MNKCCENAEQLSVVVTNIGSENKTFRVFGGATDLPSVDNNGWMISQGTSIPLGAPFSNSVYVSLFDPITGYFYVGSVTDGVYVIDSFNDNAIINHIVTGNSPDYMLLVPSLNRIYITCREAVTNNLFVIDSSDASLVATKTIGSGASQSVFNPINGYLYTACKYDVVLSIFDTATNTVLPSVSILADPGDVPRCLAYDSVQNYIYITSGNDVAGKVTVFNPVTSAVIDLVQCQDQPNEIIYNNGFMYVSNYLSDSVSVIDTSDNSVSNLSGFITAGTLVYVSSTNLIYVCGANSIGVISPVTNQAVLPFVTPSPDDSITDIIYNPFNDAIYVLIRNHVVIFNSSLTEEWSSIQFTEAIGGLRDFSVLTNGDVYVPLSSAFSIGVANTQPIVSIVVNSGVNTIEGINTDAISNPKCACKIKFDTETKEAFNNPFEKNRWQNTGSIDNTKISLLQKFTASQRSGINTVTIEAEDLKTCDLDGENYLEWVVPENSSVTLTIDYCEYDRSKEIDYSKKRKRPRTKRYNHGAFKYSIN